MAVNLHTKYADKLALKFTHESFLAGKTSKDWKWDGAAHVVLTTITTQTPGTYSRTAGSNRFGTPAELQDTIQTIDILQDKSFSIVIDHGNNTQQQMIKRAGEVMNAQIKEQMVPEADTYALGVYATGAGQDIVTGNLSKTNILDALVKVEAALADAFAPEEGRYVFLPNIAVGYLRQSLTNCDTITDKLLLKGVVGKFGTLNVVGIPASMMPSGATLLAFQSKAVVLPMQITKTIIHEDPQGFDGNVLEGRYLYDAAVVDAYKAACIKGKVS